MTPGVSSQIYLIGIESLERLALTDRERLRQCRAIVLSRRHRELLAPLLAEFPAVELVPIAPVQRALEQIALFLEEGDVAALASGDPLFFGIGRTLLNAFGSERLVISPALSSMQMACARFRIPWDTLRFFSLHGRQMAHLPSLLCGGQPIFLFTDQHNSPDRIARLLLAECGPEINDRYRVHTAENLGLEGEALGFGRLSEIAHRQFGPLTVMILTPVPEDAGPLLPFPLGLTEEEIVHSRGLITKNEVRAATLHSLRLPENGVLWDIGAGSGSLGIEASRLCPGLQVLAVEKDQKQLENIEENRKRFQAWNLRCCPGLAPEILAELPDPDRVFIGGSAGRLGAIIAEAARRLIPGGRIVINAVLPATAACAPAYLAAQGLQVTISEIAVTRRRYPPAPTNDEKESQTTMNPITMIVGQKMGRKTEPNKELRP